MTQAWRQGRPGVIAGDEDYRHALYHQLIGKRIDPLEDYGSWNLAGLEK